MRGLNFDWKRISSGFASEKIKYFLRYIMMQTMNNTFYLVRHGETVVDKDEPVSKWKLSTRGLLQAEMLAKDRELSKADIIISSSEAKAYETAFPLARKLDKEIDRYSAFDELKRDRGGFLKKETFDFAVKYAVKNPDRSKFSWEKAGSALERFTAKIQELDLAYNSRNIVIVSHGIVLNMYFAALLGRLHEAYERLQRTRFCDYGIVKDSKVVKDIVR